MNLIPQNTRSTVAFERPTEGRELKILDAVFSIGGLQNRVFDLLAAIETEGSLVAAAKRAGLSYKGAWDMIERASLLSPRPLIDRNPGGGVDRGTRLTETGRGLLDIHRRLETRKEGILQVLNHELSSDPILLQWYRRLILQSSTRNQWRAEVLSIKTGVVRNEVSVRLPGGVIIVASVSRACLTELALDFGVPVTVLVKTPMVQLMMGAEGYAVSAENQFQGLITDIVGDGLSVEAIVQLSSGLKVTTALSNDCFSEMNLKEGAKVMVFFDADAVILAAVSS